MRKILILAVTAGVMFSMKYICTVTKDAMKRYFTFLCLMLSFLAGFASCSTDEPIPVPETEQPEHPKENETDNNDSNDDNNNDTPMSNQLKITVGQASFTATFADNATAAAFKSRLPLTLNMSELNGNEKYFYLPESLPAAASNPGTIRAGDLMLYGSDCLVLFYETFRTSYSYTRIGRIDNPSGLAAALGRGSVSVTFSL